jgi:hypothetical protein
MTALRSFREKFTWSGPCGTAQHLSLHGAPPYPISTQFAVRVDHHDSLISTNVSSRDVTKLSSASWSSAEKLSRGHTSTSVWKMRPSECSRGNFCKKTKLSLPRSSWCCDLSWFEWWGRPIIYCAFNSAEMTSSADFPTSNVAANSKLVNTLQHVFMFLF